MKKVLIITYYWPPSGGSGVQRWLKFAKYLPEYGWEPVIYTPENPEANATDTALLNDVAPETQVIKTKILEPYGIYKTLFCKRKLSSSGKNNSAEVSASSIKANLIGSSDNSLKHRFALFLRGNFFIPDPRFLWIRPSVKFLKKYLRNNPVDAIVSTGPPHSMHLIAKKVAKSAGIKWIADFRDPWTEIFYFKHLKLSRYALYKHRKLEQSVLDNADKIIVVSRQMQKDFAARTSVPVEIITNGFDPEDFAAYSGKMELRERTESLREKKFILTHTGIFVDNGNPDYLWEVLGDKASQEEDFRNALLIRLMGQADNTVLNGIENAGLGKNLVNMGYVTHNEAICRQQESSVLLLPLRKEPEAAGILTGKFFEYLASGKQILAFGPTDGDLAAALKETGSGTITDFGDKEGIRREIDILYGRFKRSLSLPEGDASTGKESAHVKPGYNVINPKALKYSRIALTEKLAGLLNDL